MVSPFSRTPKTEWNWPCGFAPRGGGGGRRGPLSPTSRRPNCFPTDPKPCTNKRRPRRPRRRVRPQFRGARRDVQLRCLRRGALLTDSRVTARCIHGRICSLLKGRSPASRKCPRALRAAPGPSLEEHHASKGRDCKSRGVNFGPCLARAC